MLIGIFSGLSAAVGLLVCANADAFAGFNWLWILPACFAGSFLVLAALWFGMMLIMAKCVDMEKTQENDNRFYRTVLMLTVDALVSILRVHIHTEGLERIPKEGRFLLVCNHLHDIDPAMLLLCFPKSQLGFIGKREVAQMSLVGPFLKMTMGQFVNRENDREALKTILECIRVIKEDKTSIAVFPEGYIHKEDRRLHPFRPGVFKIAQKAKVPIVVCTLRDTHTALDKVKKLKSVDIHVHLLAVIPAEELEGVTTVDIAHRVYDMMAKDLGPDLVWPLEENT